MKNLHDTCKVVAAIPPLAVSDGTARESAWIDTLGYGGIEFIISTGSIADAAAEFSIFVEDSNSAGQASPSDITAVDDSDLLGSERLAGFGVANDNQVRKIGYRGNKRYARLTVLPVNNSSPALFAVVALLAPRLN